MAYNYGAPPGAYAGGQRSYGYPGGGPPGMAPPPGIGAPPGMDGPPGMMAQSPSNAHASQFQAPPNMGGINLNAPVIRLGVQDQGPKPGSPADRLTGAQGGGRMDGARGSNAEPLGRGPRAGIGGDRNIDRERAAVRESMMTMQPPTREEVSRTIFVGGLCEGTPNDDEIENILRCAGKLHRWTRATDAEDKLCKFGFAAYADVQSLEAANEIFGNVEVPIFKGNSVVKNEDGENQQSKLLVVVDEQSKAYIEEWKGKVTEEEDARQFRLDGCKEDLRQCLASLANSGAFAANGTSEDAEMKTEDDYDEKKDDNAEVVTIPVTLEDELSDIPAEQRATVAEEIKAFRYRSNIRDLERTRKEEEAELAEKNRSINGSNSNRFGPPATPSGPASASNGVPVGPRGTVQAPAGPRGYRGAQIPNDYANGVAFVGANGTTSNGVHIKREDDDAEESDEELERKRQADQDAELERQYQEAERRVVARENVRIKAMMREQARTEVADKEIEREKEIVAQRLREWDDEKEQQLGNEDYYHDINTWLSNRQAYRYREDRDDDRDRDAEKREEAEERRRTAEARGLADNFLDQTSNELEQRVADQPGGFKISLGNAAARNKATAQAGPRRGMGEIENLLEDEEDAAAEGRKRPELKPLADTSTVPMGSDMTDAERAAARQQLAAEIPTGTDELFDFPVKFNYLSPQILENHIKPFIEKKIVEYLGVQEDLLVETVMDGLKERKGARDVVERVEEALEDEAVGLVRKVWRIVVFWTEREARGVA